VRVADRASFKQLLETEKFDLIISDYHLPSFTGLQALAMAKKNCPHTPFILVSGTIGEQAAIESLKAGATDYVLKQHPERLPTAVRRAVKEAAERAKLRETRLELTSATKNISARSRKIRSTSCIFNREGNVSLHQPVGEECAGLHAGGIARPICICTCSSGGFAAREGGDSTRAGSSGAHGENPVTASKAGTVNGGGWNSSATTGWTIRKSRASWSIAAT
jgi:CheY-like chemotaxis protein